MRSNFIGWVVRFYTSGIPAEIMEKLVELKAEIIKVPEMNMLSRFSIVGDATVDRFIIRDVDSRLNARDR